MPSIEVGTNDPPMGYSFVGIFDSREKVDRWYAAAEKAKDKKPYYLKTYPDRFVLFVKKRKGEGKMLGKGWGVEPEPIRSKRKR